MAANYRSGRGGTPFIEPLEHRRLLAVVLAGVASTPLRLEVGERQAGPSALSAGLASRGGSADSTPISAGTQPLALEASALGEGGIRISWQPLNLGPTAYIQIYRKPLEATFWDLPEMDFVPRDATHYDDTTALPGTRYEYRVSVTSAPGAEPSDKYILAGNAADPVSSRGSVLIVVDETQLRADRDAAGTTLAPALERYRLDLIAEGYHVHTMTAPRVDVPRQPPADTSPEGIAAHYGAWSAQVMTLKQRIRDAWQADPQIKYVSLIGHVAVPRSGIVNPDGPLHTIGGAWSVDAFYGTLTAPDSVWTDTMSSPGVEATVNYPGDGKFDQDTMFDLGAGTEWAGQVYADVAVGRVDFAMLRQFADVGSEGVSPATPGETWLLARYLERAHEWRTGQWDVKRQALFDEQFPFAEYYDTNRLTPNVGFDKIVRGFAAPVEPNISAPDTPYPEGAPPPTRYDLNEDTWLWMYAGAGGYPTRTLMHLALPRALRSDQYVNGEYSSQFDFSKVTQFGTHKAVFNFLYASYVGDWDYLNALLRTAIAEPEGLGLATAWGGRPNWEQHHMGLGEPIGVSLVKTLNNFSEQLAYTLRYNGAIRTGLMGDPTLRQDNVRPPADVQVSFAGDQASLSWTPSSDPAVGGYYVYRSTSADQGYELASPQRVEGTSFVDADALPGQAYYYLVRAAKLEETPSGTYWNLSLGAAAAPTVASHRSDPAGRWVELTFSQDVGPTLDESDLVMTGRRLNLSTGQWVDVTLVAGVDFDLASYDATSRTARIDLHDLRSGRYEVGFAAGSVVNDFAVAIDASLSIPFAYLAGDTNGDLRVDFDDLLALAQSYGSGVPAFDLSSGDFNGDGVVDFDDLLVLAQHYGASL